GWHRRRPSGSDPGPLKRGLGVAGTTWDGSGLPRTEAEGTIGPGDRGEVSCGTQDIGTGTRPLLPHVGAGEVSLPVHGGTGRLGDSYFPYWILSGGSLTAACVTPAARTAAGRVREQLLRLAAPKLGAAPDELELAEREIVVRGTGKRLPWSSALQSAPEGSLS